MNEKKLENYFDNTMAMISKNPLDYYLLVMIGRGVPFKPHVIKTGPKYIMFEQEFEKDFEGFKNNHPDAVGTLDAARLESKEMIVGIFINMLRMEEEIARNLVMGDFEQGIMDVSKIEIEELQ